MEDSGGVPWLKSGLSAMPSATARYKIPKDRRSGARPSTKASQKLGRLLRPKVIAPHSPCERMSIVFPLPNCVPVPTIPDDKRKTDSMIRQRPQLRSGHQRPYSMIMPSAPTPIMTNMLRVLRLLVGLPLLGVLLAGQPIRPYLEIPPQTRFV